MSDTGGAGSPIGGQYYGGAVYHEVSPKWSRAVRIAGIVTCLMVALSFIFTLVQGTKNTSLYLMTCNLIITSFVGLVNAWWYRQGHLGADKYWFMLALAGVILFQCLATDIFVFNIDDVIAPDTTIAPSTTMHTTHNTTLSSTTHTTPHTTPP